MYKYIVYCSVSAAIIIASKYLYQHWIKQNHIISTLKQDIGLLTDKVKRLEAEMEKRAHVYSGGVHIPIEFVKSSKPNTIILFKDDAASASASASASALVSTASVSSGSSSSSSLAAKHQKKTSEDKSPSSPPKSPPKSPTPSPSPTPSVQKSLDICVQQEEETEQEKEQEKEEDTTVQSLISNSINGKERRRKKLPDAKQYTNGTKIKDEEDQCEYLCVVGKRGGHSWKKI